MWYFELLIRQWANAYGYNSKAPENRGGTNKKFYGTHHLFYRFHDYVCNRVSDYVHFQYASPSLFIF
jgi:hypothetical protein